MNDFTLLGIGTALPEFSISRDESFNYAVDHFRIPEENQRRLKALYRLSGVKKRYSVLLKAPEDAPAGERQKFLYTPDDENDLGPRLGLRMKEYEREAAPLALEASRRAIDRAKIAPDAVTHLVTVSCSGFVAPGVDIELIKGLALRPTVERTHVGFMGCHGALNGLRVAQGFARGNPESLILVCAVELCTLHYHYWPDPEQVVSNALFGDGAAAAIGAPRAAGANGAWSIKATGSCLIPESEDAMTWRVRDHGFAMSLSSKVPDLIGDHLRDWLAPWLEGEGVAIEDVKSWAIHPGGPRIVSSVAETLGLESTATQVSRDILRDHGNMSSPTILFILHSLRNADAPLPCLALAFGPGLMVEAVLFA